MLGSGARQRLGPVSGVLEFSRRYLPALVTQRQPGALEIAVDRPGLFIIAKEVGADRPNFLRDDEVRVPRGEAADRPGWAISPAERPPLTPIAPTRAPSIITGYPPPSQIRRSVPDAAPRAK